MTIKHRIKRSVSNRKKEGFVLTSDFSGFGSRNSVAVALRELVKEGFLIRVALGVYATTEWNEYAKERIASMPLGSIAPMALQKMGKKIRLGKLSQEYADGRTTQIPNENVYEIGNQNISRKFNLYGRTVYYEKNGRPVKNGDKTE